MVRGKFIVKNPTLSPKNKQAVHYKAEAQMLETSLQYFMGTKRKAKP